MLHYYSNFCHLFKGGTTSDFTAGSTPSITSVVTPGIVDEVVSNEVSIVDNPCLLD